MSVVIIGGHDRMVSQYKKICKNYKCKAKVFTQMSASMDKQIGRPDLLVLFTNTVSHKMIKCALDEVDASQTEIVRCHTSSGTALTEILACKCGGITATTPKRRSLPRTSTSLPGRGVRSYPGTRCKKPSSIRLTVYPI